MRLARAGHKPAGASKQRHAQHHVHAAGNDPKEELAASRVRTVRSHQRRKEQMRKRRQRKKRRQDMPAHKRAPCKQE